MTSRQTHPHSSATTFERPSARFDVSVVGELNLDLILYGLPERLEPEREYLAERMALTLGSSAAIFAHNLAAMGSRVAFVSRIGNDPLGRMAMEKLAESGADVSHVRIGDGLVATGLTVVLPHERYRNILTYPGAMFDLRFEDLDLDILASARHLHLSSFFLLRALRPRIGELFTAMKRAGLTTSLDTNDDPADLWESDLPAVLPCVDVLFVNEREAMKIFGQSDLESALDRLAGLVPVVVVKQGAGGARARHGAEECFSQALPVECVDPVGAGDSFNAGFIHHYIAGRSLQTCLDHGNRAGALSVTRLGGTEAFRDREAVRQFLEGRRAEPPEETIEAEKENQ